MADMIEDLGSFSLRSSPPSRHCAPPPRRVKGEGNADKEHGYYVSGALTSLEAAIRAGDVSGTLRALGQHPKEGMDFRTHALDLMILAIQSDKTAVLQLLLAAGGMALLDSRTMSGETMLHSAVVRCDLEVAELLLSVGATADVPDSVGKGYIYRKASMIKNEGGVRNARKGSDQLTAAVVPLVRWVERRYMWRQSMAIKRSSIYLLPGALQPRQLWIL